MTKDERHFTDLPNTAQAVDLLQRIASLPPYPAPPKIDKPLYLYGAGSLGRMAWDYLKIVGVPVVAVIDKNAQRLKQDPFWADARLLVPEDIPQDAKHNALLAICVVTSSWGDVTEPLRADGWQNIMPFYTLCAGYKDIHPLDNGWLTGPLTAQDQKEMGACLSDFTDGTSRAHYLQFVAWHALQQEWSFSAAPIVGDNRYFIPEVLSLLHDHEIFADLGAHHGHSCAHFIKCVQQKFAKIVAIEADMGNVAVLRHYVETLSADMQAKISIKPIVLSHEQGTGQFRSGLDYVSRIVETGAENMPLHTLDQCGITPTFIKAHLEGGELNALIGGLKTIRQYRPIIALTIYHNRLGLWTIAKRLRDELQDMGYRFLFRLHGWQGTGAVLYLIPTNRPN